MATGVCFYRCIWTAPNHSVLRKDTIAEISLALADIKKRADCVKCCDRGETWGLFLHCLASTCTNWTKMSGAR